MPLRGQPLTPNHTYLNLSRLDGQEILSVLKMHKEALSQFEQTTVLEIYENRIGVGPRPYLGVLLIAMVILSGSAFVPLGVSLDVANPLLKVSWRISGLLPFLGILGLL